MFCFACNYVLYSAWVFGMLTMCCNYAQTCLVDGVYVYLRLV